MADRLPCAPYPDTPRPPTVWHGLWRLQVVRFMVVSAVATVVDLAAYRLVLLAVPPEGPGHGLWLALAVTIGYTLGTWVHFAIARRWVFQPSAHRTPAEAALVYLVAIVGLAVTYVAVGLLVSWVFHLDYLVGRAIALIPSFIWNYGGRRWLIYRTPGVPMPVREGTPARAGER